MSDNSVTRAFDDSGRQQLLESVIADDIRACDAGAVPDQRTILERHPELADDLRDFFAQRDHLNQLARPIRELGDSLSQCVGPGKHISDVGDYELLEEVARERDGSRLLRLMTFDPNGLVPLVKKMVG